MSFFKTRLLLLCVPDKEISLMDFLCVSKHLGGVWLTKVIIAIFLFRTKNDSLP